MSDSTEAVQEPVPPAEADRSESGPKRRKRPGKGRGGKSAAEPGQPGQAPENEAGTAQAPDAASRPADGERPGSGAPAPGDAGSQADAEVPVEDGVEDLASDGPTDEELVRQVSALLFASPDPLGPGRLAKVLGTSQGRVKTAMAEIHRRLEDSGLGFELRGLAGGSTFMTPPALGDIVAGLSTHAAVERISPAALETLAVIAYRQPVTKAEIEAIRGVQAGPVLRSLVDRGLVRVVGRSDEPGHALQYGTSKEFLSRFGLQSLDDLPRDGELARD